MDKNIVNRSMLFLFCLVLLATTSLIKLGDRTELSAEFQSEDKKDSSPHVVRDAPPRLVSNAMVVEEGVKPKPLVQNENTVTAKQEVGFNDSAVEEGVTDKLHRLNFNNPEALRARLYNMISDGEPTQWTSQISQQINNVIKSESPAESVSNYSIDCRSALCAIEFNDVKDSKFNAAFARTLRAELSQDSFPHMHLNYLVTEFGQSNAVFFLFGKDFEANKL